MIDTVRVSIPEWSHSDVGVFTLQRGPMVRGEHENEMLLCWDDYGRELVGHKAYYNDPTGLYAIDIGHFNGERYASIQFSIPKVFRQGDNFHPVDVKDSLRTLAWIEEDAAARARFRFNICDTVLKRIDLFKNIIPDYRFPVYKAALGYMRARRGKIVDYGVTGHLLGNTQWQVCMYLKTEEMKKRGLDMNQYDYDERTLRVESRLMNDRKIVKTLGISTLVEAVTNPDVLQKYYVESLKKTVFRTPPTGTMVLPQAIDEIIRLALEVGGDKFMSKFAYFYALYTLPTSGTDLEMLEAKLRDAASELTGRNRSVSRFMDELAAIDRVRVLREKAEGEAKGKTVSDLYEELQEKLIGQEA